MDVSSPLSGLFPAVDSSVVIALSRATRPRTGREIARAAERSQPAVQKVLDRFVEQGLVNKERAGRANVYVLNREHLAAPALMDLAGLRAGLVTRLKEEFGSWNLQPLHASIFGSATRGDGTAKSDIDIFVVRPADVDQDDPRWGDQIETLARGVLAWTGNHAGIAEVSEDELQRLRHDRPPVVKSLRLNGIDLAGETTLRLLSR